MDIKYFSLKLLCPLCYQWYHVYKTLILHLIGVIFSDLIGVISHIGPHDFASATSHIKLRKLKIMDLK
jgi:hypothetical protein